MRKIAMIGCGSSAMILAHALLNHGGYDVPVYLQKTAQQRYVGPPTGTPFVAGENSDIKRALGLEHWEDEMFFGDGVMLDFLAHRGADPLTVRGRFGEAQTCATFVAIAKSTIAELAPEDAAAVEALRPVDDRFNYRPFAVGISPLVRRAVGALPSGTFVMPLGDTGITYDPIGGQGYNSAARHSQWVAEAIIAHDGAAFDAGWAQEVFDGFWEAHGRWARAWNNLMLTGLPPATGIALQHAAANPDFGDLIFGDYFRPAGFMRWISDPDAVGQQVATHRELTRQLTRS